MLISKHISRTLNYETRQKNRPQPRKIIREDVEPTSKKKRNAKAKLGNPKPKAEHVGDGPIINNTQDFDNQPIYPTPVNCPLPERSSQQMPGGGDWNPSGSGPDLLKISILLPSTDIIWSDLLMRRYWHWADVSGKVAKVNGKRINNAIGSYLENVSISHFIIKHPKIRANERDLYIYDGTHLSDKGNDIYSITLRVLLTLFYMACTCISSSSQASG